MTSTSLMQPPVAMDLQIISRKVHLLLLLQLLLQQQLPGLPLLAQTRHGNPKVIHAPIHSLIGKQPKCQP